MEPVLESSLLQSGTTQWNLSFETSLIKKHLLTGDKKLCPGKMFT